MGDKKQETITKYLGDMKSVVSHVYEAMERQKDEFMDQPDVSQTIARIALGLKGQGDDIELRQKGLGGSPTQPVKEAVAGAAGVLAGLYNKVRTEGAAKGLRDDHVALNLAIVSYSTLHTTAVAFGDLKTAELAKNGLTECAKFAMDVQKLLPGVVLRELQDGDFGTLDAGAPQQTSAAMRSAWGAPEPATETARV
ncbi:MAG TPA: DUF892 family protein [Candidatus Limnocylindria bacterium]|jgi:ferritin-like metal-binding protein YciE